MRGTLNPKKRRQMNLEIIKAQFDEEFRREQGVFIEYSNNTSK